MKTSELIDKLISIKERYGDHEVRVWEHPGFHIEIVNAACFIAGECEYVLLEPWTRQAICDEVSKE